MVYEPSEDSFLLEKEVMKHAVGKVLDMGTGSGILAISAAKRKNVRKVYAVDIDMQAIKDARMRYHGKKIIWKQSDLFSSFPKAFMHSFDTIIFNPPYLPSEKKEKYLDLEGGKEGNEAIERFLEKARDYLKLNGKILILVSTLTPRVPFLFEKSMFIAEKLGEESFFSEKIRTYKLVIDNRIKEVEKKGVSSIQYFSHGKRGIIFTARYKNKKIAIKLAKKESMAQGTIEHEARMLKQVNRHAIGPKYLFHTKDAIAYLFIEGTPLKELLKSANIKKICGKVFIQCRTLDRIRIDKKEMTRPLKHAIINKEKVTLIDFERARKTPRPHNVTQFCQFIHNHVTKQKKEWIRLSREYSKKPCRETFDQLISAVKNE